ncbi:signal recognition particle-docking protein FtsY [Shuttleworthella satelles DSM 14600]|uniref:Signal recognition particle receptor FtsY n=1 Tax=Shuttleworthella satelles DSM 14600 TaxID=626523 RepID=C4GAY5_9FIRM|nr:signal recognition particle-docking protein FtsY [Shuttleworthia satelles]EEP28278.1 signal recognition particle-docking protein FtsY [Shuttleworthia satelles DSM 14600]
MGFFSRLKAGLSKTRDGFVKNMDYVFSGFSRIDEDFYEELEEVLISGDLGVQTSMRLIENLRQEVKDQHIKEAGDCRQLLIDDIRRQMDVGENAYDFEQETSVLMMVGVNGVGKTTTVGKLAAKFKQEKKKRVLIAAADTFRAAANEQLKEWADRAGVDMIGGQEGSDPAAVVFDAVQSAKARNCDILLVDTAGRLHNKTNLMHELEKINRVIDREYEGVHRETLAVLDATSGQNALVQAREFAAVANVTGIVLTKMDGSAKGGIAVAIQSELGIPVKYIGVGETVEDLERFDADQYVNALFDLKDEDDDIAADAEGQARAGEVSVSEVEAELSDSVEQETEAPEREEELSDQTEDKIEVSEGEAELSDQAEMEAEVSESETGISDQTEDKIEVSEGEAEFSNQAEEEVEASAGVSERETELSDQAEEEIEAPDREAELSDQAEEKAEATETESEPKEEKRGAFFGFFRRKRKE